MTGKRKNPSPDRETLGLCATCRFQRELATKRGSIFLRCARADRDKDFDRYPRLPVRACRGHSSAHDFGME